MFAYILTLMLSLGLHAPTYHVDVAPPPGDDSGGSIRNKGTS